MVKNSVAALVAALVSFRVAVAQETVLYDFWLPSCPPCRQMEPTVGRLISARYPVRKINVTGRREEQDLARRFRVTECPCFVMVVHGREVDRIVGATSYQRLEQMVRRGAGPSNSTAPPRSRTQSPDPPSSQDPWAEPNGAAAGNRPRSQHWPATGRNASKGNSPSAEGSKLIQSTVRIRVDDAKGHSWGTGTLIDARNGEALVITCGHIFRDSQGTGTITVELFEPTPGGPDVADRVAGQLVSYDLELDVGFVSIRPNRSVCTAPVADTTGTIRSNDKVTSMGCSHGSYPTAMETHVTAINRYLDAPNIEAAGGSVDGRSGGGLFNERGELIGICLAADPEYNEGLYRALKSIHDELDRLGLTDVYEDQQREHLAPSDVVLTSITSNELPPEESSEPSHSAPIERGQELLEPVANAAQNGANLSPCAAQVLATVESTKSRERSADPALSAVERAAWEELMGRASETEVVCIIRPKSPDGRSEVITLNNVSQEFVRRLVERSTPPTAPR